MDFSIDLKGILVKYRVAEAVQDNILAAGLDDGAHFVYSWPEARLVRFTQGTSVKAPDGSGTYEAEALQDFVG